MSCELREGDFEAFFRTPFECYGPASHYVSPLKSDLKRFLDGRRNPLFTDHGSFTYFTLHREGRPIGRLVAHLHDDSNRIHRLERSYFGFFDCIDDDAAARRLLGAAEDWGRRRGCSEIAGNFNLTAMQQIGVVTDGFEHPPYLDQLYNPAHIPRLLEACGYEPFFPMCTFELELRACDPRRLLGPRQQAVLASTELRWERLRIRGFRRLMEAARQVLNDGFAGNPMFVPLSSEEYSFQAKEMMWIIDQRIAPIVFCADRPVGVVVCIPDLNPLLRTLGSRLGWSAPIRYLRHWRARRRAVIVYYAVSGDFQGRGLMGAMLLRTIELLQASGYTHLGITWIADVNTASLRQMEKLGARRLHRTHLFRKRLSGP